MKKLRPWHYLFLLVLVISTIWILRNRTTEMQNSEGRIFGTTYHAKYEYPTSLETEIMERLQQVDATFSMFYSALAYRFFDSFASSCHFFDVL